MGEPRRHVARRLATKTPDYLIEQFEKSTDDRLRAGILVALGELSYPRSPAFPGEAEWSAGALKEPAERAAAAARTREIAYPVLVGALANPSSVVSDFAAIGLAILATGGGYAKVAPDPRAAGPLTAWCRRRKLVFFNVAKYLLTHGGPEVGAVFQQIVRERGGESPAWVREGLRKWQPAGTAPILVQGYRTCRERHKHWHCTEYLEELGNYGGEGAAALMGLLPELDNLWAQQTSAAALAKLGHRPAAGPIRQVLEQTIDGGPGETDFISRRKKNRASYPGTVEGDFSSFCQGLLEALSALDPPAGREVAEKVLLQGPAALRGAALKTWAEEMRQ